MSTDSHTRLIQELVSFAQCSSWRSLWDFQRLAGWLNRALNVYLLLRPGLSALYAKTAGKLVLKALIWVNRDVVRELSWVVNHLHFTEGIFFFNSVSCSFGGAVHWIHWCSNAFSNPARPISYLYCVKMYSKNANFFTNILKQSCIVKNSQTTGVSSLQGSCIH
jgi:hypothetical protein